MDCYTVCDINCKTGHSFLIKPFVSIVKMLGQKYEYLKNETSMKKCAQEKFFIHFSGGGYLPPNWFLHWIKKHGVKPLIVLEKGFQMHNWEFNKGNKYKFWHFFQISWKPILKKFSNAKLILKNVIYGITLLFFNWTYVAQL